MNKLFIFSLFTFISFSLFAQINEDEALARQYFRNEEFDKALVLYEKLFNKNPANEEYYSNYFNTLLAIKDFSKAEKLVRKQIKKLPHKTKYRVDLGKVFQAQSQSEKAEKEFDEAINLLTPDEMEINSLANSFSAIHEYDFAIKTFLKAQKLFKDEYFYAYELAVLHQATGDVEKMVSSYLDFVTVNPSQIQLVKNEIQEMMESEKKYKEFQSQMYKRVQKNPDDILFSDLLIWSFLQKKDYENAFIQTRALDKRYKMEGAKILNLAFDAKEDGEYYAAVKCYQYILDLGKNNRYYLMAKSGILDCKRLKILDATDVSQEELLNVEKEYLAFINEYGKNGGTANTTRDLANLYAFHFHDLNKAISLLEEIINSPSVEKTLLAYCKLELGDYYLMSGDVWEPVLLYGQVDKEFRNGEIGEEARFRNTKLSYYKGEFEWAKAQANVLKASTSRLIANDALDLSIFIQENLGVDSNLAPMELFTKADLLIFQNKNDEATKILDSLQTEYPIHELGDDILFAKAKIFLNKKKYSEASMVLQKLVNEFPQDILADDALFQLAEMNEKKLNDNEKAKLYYEKIITDYIGSLFVVEARKRFRKLRGDTIN